MRKIAVAISKSGLRTNVAKRFREFATALISEWRDISHLHELIIELFDDSPAVEGLRWRCHDASCGLELGVRLMMGICEALSQQCIFLSEILEMTSLRGLHA